MKNSQENTTFILADVKVFDFLKEKAGDRKTKTEAYWDLLDRSMAGFVSPFVRKVERKLLSNQCHVTISDLAESWHWHRATVRTFLDALESFGLLERTKLKKSVIITMTVQSGKTAIAETEQEEPDFATRIGSILSEWVIGKRHQRTSVIHAVRLFARHLLSLPMEIIFRLPTTILIRYRQKSSDKKKN